MTDDNPLMTFPLQIPDAIIKDCKIAAHTPGMRYATLIAEITEGKHSLDSAEEFSDFLGAIWQMEHRSREFPFPRKIYQAIDRINRWGNLIDKKAGYCRILLASVEGLRKTLTTKEELFDIVGKAWEKAEKPEELVG